MSVWLFATRGLGWGEREVETIGDRLPLFYCPCIRLNNPTPQFHLNSTQGVDSHSKAEVLVLSFVKRMRITYHLNPSSSPASNIVVVQKQFPALSKVSKIRDHGKHFVKRPSDQSHEQCVNFTAAQRQFVTKNDLPSDLCRRDLCNRDFVQRSRFRWCSFSGAPILGPNAPSQAPSGSFEPHGRWNSCNCAPDHQFVISFGFDVIIL